MRQYDVGKEIIANEIGEAFGGNVDLENTLIHFYGNCNETIQARKRFDNVPKSEMNVQTVTCILEAYCKNNLNEECVQLFEQMKGGKQRRDAVWYAIAIKACTQGTMLHFGKKIHADLENMDADLWTDTGILVNLLNMYGKCGMMNDCVTLFDGIAAKNVDVCNAMIHAYGRNARMEEAMRLFDGMKMEADVKTFVLILNGCAHVGEVDRAKDIWENRIVDEKMKYDIYVMTALIDCMARKGELREAMALMIEHDLREEIVWKALLSGCTKHNDSQMAKQVHDEMIKRLIN